MTVFSTFYDILQPNQDPMLLVKFATGLLKNYGRVIELTHACIHWSMIELTCVVLPEPVSPEIIVT
jgi:hypothetical protein